MDKPTDCDRVAAATRSELIFEGGRQARIQGVSLKCAAIYAEGWAAASQARPELLTDEEHKAMQLTADLYNLLCRIVGSGRTRSGDLAEACIHIHALQHAVMSQAAARAYPDRYRLLGDTIRPTEEPA